MRGIPLKMGRMAGVCHSPVGPVAWAVSQFLALREARVSNHGFSKPGVTGIWVITFCPGTVLTSSEISSNPRIIAMTLGFTLT